MTPIETSPDTLRALIQASPLAIVAVDPEGCVTMWNPAAEHLFGWREFEVVGRPLPVVPADRQAEYEAFRARALRGGAVTGVEVRRQRRDGSVVDISLSTAPIRDEDGTTRGVVAFMVDITERTRAETALRESERRYRLLADHATDVIWVTDMDLRLAYVSPSVTRLRGYTPEESLTQTLQDRLTPASLERVMTVWAEERAGEARPDRDPARTRTLELEFRCQDGSTIWTETTVSGLRDDAQRLVGLLGVTRDITERRHAEEQVRLQAAALDAAANGIVITDAQGVILWVNPAFTRLTGYAADEAIGRTPRLLKSGSEGQDAAFYASLWQTILSGRVWEGELVNRRRDGSLYWERQTITPVRDSAGGITHFIAIKQDVTAWKEAAGERQRERDRLYQTEKVAAMGQLLAGVAHELNNPLSVVIGQASLLRYGVKDGPVAARAEKIAQAAERCGRIVKNFLALARQRPPERQEVQLNPLVEGAVELLAYQLRVANVQVALELAEDLPVLWADPHELHQVIVNLLTNAQDAMRASPPPRRIAIATRVDPTRTRLSLQVADTGPGIPPDVQRRIFEPFFTTKPPGQGTGLGLSLCLGIIESHGGTLRVESEPGRGALFSIDLPVQPMRTVTTGAEGREPAPPIRGKSVLVVDDEPDVAAVLAEILADDAHEVDTAAHGVAALAKLAHRRYDLILSDLRMPELDGPGLYQVLEDRFPELCRRVVFLTGDALGPGIVEFLGRAARPTLHKPFAAADVHRVTQEAFRATCGVKERAPSPPAGRGTRS